MAAAARRPLATIEAMLAGDPAPWDARPGSRLRGFLLFPLAAGYAFGYALIGSLWANILPSSFQRHRTAIIHGWGKGLLRILGIRLVVHGAENLGPAPRIVVFNHVSLLDLMVLTAMWPEHCTVLYKREFHRIPVLGRAMRAALFIPVDRGNREAAQRSIAAATAKVREEGWSILIAPEGTRSRQGGLQPFKMGPFHLAIQTRAPVVPMIFRGIDQVLPMGRLVPRTGAVRVDVLEPVDTREWRSQDVRERADEIREIFLRYVPPVGTA